MNKLEELCEILEGELQPFYETNYCDGDEYKTKYEYILDVCGENEITISLKVGDVDGIRKYGEDRYAYDYVEIDEITIDDIDNVNISDICNEICDQVAGWFTTQEIMSEMDECDFD